ncbi:MAG: hypothetical protein WCD76_06150 [Pyrinomonadaceae bacterium]
MKNQIRVRRWLIFLALSLTAFGAAGTRMEEPALSQRAEQDGRPDGSGIQATTPDALEMRREQARFRKQQAEEEWQQAVRSYPNGIPGDARLLALQQMEASERAAKRPDAGVKFLKASATLASRAAPQFPIQDLSWFPIGPSPITGGQTYAGIHDRVEVSGRSTVIAVNPSNASDVWLGTALGGVWHSTNGGQNWKPMSDQEASLAIGAVVLDVPGSCANAETCGTIYAGTGENAIRRDTYYGAGLLVGKMKGGEFPEFLWSLRGANLFKFGSINKVVLDPTTSGSTKRIFVSLSSGVTASASQSTFTAPKPSMGYGLYLSNNNGVDWTKLTVQGTSDGDRPTDLEIDPQNHDILYAGFLGRGIFKSINNGATWCPLNPGIVVAGCPAAPGLPNPTTTLTFDHVELAIHRPSAASQAILYAAFGHCPKALLDSCGPSFYKSTNGGATWTQTHTGSIAEGLDSHCPRGYTRYTHALTIDPNQPNTIFWGGARLCKSTDSGATFGDVGSSSVHPDHHAIVFPNPSNSSLLYDSSDGGFASSTNGGNNWTSGNSDLQITGFQSISWSPLTDVVIGGTQDNGTNRWGGTRVWQHIADGDSSSTNMDLDDVRKMYDVYFDVTPRRSVNGGGCCDWPYILTGINTNDPSSFYPPFVQDTTAPHPFYLGTNRLYKSTNDGDNWTAVSPVLGGTGTTFPDINRTNVITAIAVAPNNSNRLYVGYYDGQLFVTSGACTTPACWTAIGGAAKGLPQAVVTRIAVDPNSANTAYVTFSGFGFGAHVFKTTNGGTNWSPASGSGSNALPDIPVNTVSIEPSASSNVWVGTDIGIYRSMDGGVSWSPFSNGLPKVAVYEIAIDETHGRVFAATHGRGAFILSQPFLSNYEGWVMGQIWDIPVFGTAFLPNTPSCTMQIIQQNGNICAQGSVDARNGTIKTDATGQLVTSNGGFYIDRPVAWACFNGNCLNGVNIATCNTPTNPLSSVRVKCGSQVGIDQIIGCPQLDNPPSSTVGVSFPSGDGDGGGGGSGGSGGATSPADTLTSLQTAPVDGFFVIVASIQSGDGATRALCSSDVFFRRGETTTQIMQRARDALNDNPECVAKTVFARVQGLQPTDNVFREDLPPDDPKLVLSAPGVKGSQLITALYARPGSATGACFDVSNIGIPVLNQLIVMMLNFETAAGGAAGGDITVLENTPLGNCGINVHTVRNETAGQIASSLVMAFQSPGIPGPNPACPSRRNPRDITILGNSLISVVSNEMVVCVRDPNVGFTLVPKGQPDFNTAPNCAAARASVAVLPNKHERMIPVSIQGVNDPNGDPVTIRIDRIMQDEPTNTNFKKREHCPDAQIVGTTTALLRAERDKHGDGRVYTIFFTASDGKGGVCQGTVKVSVPREEDCPPVDGGAKFDSTVCEP